MQVKTMDIFLYWHCQQFIVSLLWELILVIIVNMEHARYMIRKYNNWNFSASAVPLSAHDPPQPTPQLPPRSRAAARDRPGVTRRQPGSFELRAGRGSRTRGQNAAQSGAQRLQTQTKPVGPSLGLWRRRLVLTNVETQWVRQKPTDL